MSPESFKFPLLDSKYVPLLIGGGVVMILVIVGLYLLFQVSLGNLQALVLLPRASSTGDISIAALNAGEGKENAVRSAGGESMVSMWHKEGQVGISGFNEQYNITVIPNPVSAGQSVQIGYNRSQSAETFDHYSIRMVLLDPDGYTVRASKNITAFVWPPGMSGGTISYPVPQCVLPGEWFFVLRGDNCGTQRGFCVLNGLASTRVTVLAGRLTGSPQCTRDGIIDRLALRPLEQTVLPDPDGDLVANIMLDYDFTAPASPDSRYFADWVLDARGRCENNQWQRMASPFFDSSRYGFSAKNTRSGTIAWARFPGSASARTCEMKFAILGYDGVRWTDKAFSNVIRISR